MLSTCFRPPRFANLAWRMSRFGMVNVITIIYTQLGLPGLCAGDRCLFADGARCGKPDTFGHGLFMSPDSSCKLEIHAQIESPKWKRSMGQQRSNPSTKQEQLSLKVISTKRSLRFIKHKSEPNQHAFYHAILLQMSWGAPLDSRDPIFVCTRPRICFFEKQYFPGCFFTLLWATSLQ